MVIRRGGGESSINTLVRKAVIFAELVLQVDVVMAGQTYTVNKTIGLPSVPAVSSGISITGLVKLNAATCFVHSERLITPKRRTCWVAPCSAGSWPRQSSCPMSRVAS